MVSQKPKLMKSIFLKTNHDFFLHFQFIILQSALFNPFGMMILSLLFICLCAYVREAFPSMIDRSYNRGFKGLVRKAAVVGDRLSPWVSSACVIFAVLNLVYRK